MRIKDYRGKLLEKKSLRQPRRRRRPPSPDILAASIVEDLQAALEQFAAITEDLSNGTVTNTK